MTLPYDGIMFYPVQEKTEEGKIYNSGLAIAQFRHAEHNELFGAEPIESSPAGDKYRVVFYKAKDGELVKDEDFEAIFSDPEVYVKGLTGLPLFGILVRKTEMTVKKFDNHLINIEKHFTIVLQNMLKAQGESK